MFIRYGNKYIEINDAMSAIVLEAKYDLTPHGKVYSRISNALYYFRDIEVSSSQFYIMKTLAETYLSSSVITVIL
jgi:hypothetical protein